MKKYVIRQKYIHRNIMQNMNISTILMPKGFFIKNSLKNYVYPVKFRTVCIKSCRKGQGERLFSDTIIRYLHLPQIKVGERV